MISRLDQLAESLRRARLRAWKPLPTDRPRVMNLPSCRERDRTPDGEGSPVGGVPFGEGLAGEASRVSRSDMTSCAPWSPW